MIKNLILRPKALAAAGVSLAVIGGGAGAYAAIGPSAPADLTAAPMAAPDGPVGNPAGPPGPAAFGRPDAGGGHRRAQGERRRGQLVFGDLVSVSTTGGAANAGVVSVRPPDGQVVTASLGKRSRVLAYHGPGVKPTAESVSDLKAGELVALRMVQRPAPGGEGETPGNAGNSAPPAVGSTGVSYAAVIIDLGYATTSAG